MQFPTADALIVNTYQNVTALGRLTRQSRNVAYLRNFMIAQ